MKFICFLTIAISATMTSNSSKNPAPSCTCISYELKDQIENQELITHAKVIRIDTINLVESYLCNDPQWRKSFYEQKYKMLKITFQNKKTFRGRLNTDTFSIISTNQCQFAFIDKYEYIVSAHRQDFCQLEMIADSLKCNIQSLLCTNYCCGNSLFYEGVEEIYLQAMK